MHRIFVAIPIPSHIKNEIMEMRHRVGLNLTFIPSENFHITVLFMGKVSGSNSSTVASNLKNAAQEISPFTLITEMIDRKSNKHKHMLWVRFKQSDQFEKLCIKVAGALQYSLERKPVPHINLIRSEHKIAGSFPLAFPDLKVEVITVELWESTLKPSGATYSTLNSFTLKGRENDKEEW